MKNISLSFVCSLMLFYLSCSIRSNSFPEKAPNIIVEAQLDASDYKQLLFYSSSSPAVLLWMPTDHIELKQEWKMAGDDDISIGKNVRWALYSDKSIITQSALLGPGILLNPDDSIHIVLDEKGYHYSGRGAEALQLQHDVSRVQKSLKKPTNFYVIINSLDDYMKWDNYLNKCLELTLPIIESYKTKVSPFVYDWVKIHTIARIEMERAETFISLNKNRIKNKSSNLTATDMIAIGDSTLNGSWAKWLRAKDFYDGDPWYFYQYTRIENYKRFHFDFTQDSLNADDKRKVLCYNALKQNYKGQLREKLLQYSVAIDFIKKIGFQNPVTNLIVKDYYNQPGFPEYKQWMHNYEDSVRLHSKERNKG